jgi:hypothetical protein
MSADKAKKKKVKKFEEYEKKTEKTVEQLKFFNLLQLGDRYSQTLELYDFIPKYVWGKVERINGEFLRPITRNFECRGNRYQITVKPASIRDKDGVYRNYFPSKREELVEDVLRKLATMGNAILLDDQAAVTFTLYQLQKELKNKGHGYKIQDIKDALFILAETHLELTSADGQRVIKANMIESLGLQTRDDWKGNGTKTRAFVRFNPLVTAAIKAKEIRLINYETAMSLANVIARQLFKRMSHNYIQAAKDKTFNIGLLTLIRDFGLTVYPELRNNLREVLKALEELKEKNVILEYTVEKTLEANQRNKMIDALFTIQTTTDFNNEMKYVANKRDESKVISASQFQEVAESKRLLRR